MRSAAIADAEQAQATEFVISTSMNAAAALAELAVAGEMSALSVGALAANVAQQVGGAVGGWQGAVIGGLGAIAGGVISATEAQSRAASSAAKRQALGNVRWTPGVAADPGSRPIVIYQTINGTYVREGDASRAAQDAARRYDRQQGRAA